MNSALTARQSTCGRRERARGDRERDRLRSEEPQRLQLWMRPQDAGQFAAGHKLSGPLDVGRKKTINRHCRTVASQ